MPHRAPTRALAAALRSEGDIASAIHHHGIEHLMRSPQVSRCEGDGAPSIRCAGRSEIAETRTAQGRRFVEAIRSPRWASGRKTSRYTLMHLHGVALIAGSRQRPDKD